MLLSSFLKFPRDQILRSPLYTRCSNAGGIREHAVISRIVDHGWWWADWLAHCRSTCRGRAFVQIVVVDNFVRGRRENLAHALSKGPVTLIEGDIRDRALLAEVMSGVDVVFHQAAIRITQCAEEPRLALEVLAEGTFNVLEAAVQAECEEGGRCILSLGVWLSRRVSNA